ncbi:hypothetical protein ONE63_007341 [Megalurothrips usitatus]|uniref:Uncharacterized protein n=1 Tax=Megalurothrips usitatus TaxID=439358 RepID=A0AAV7XWP2_9NEOP|nr:hypothetical protein ONE63_007341 [Megalurothrips usitatus]
MSLDVLLVSVTGSPSHYIFANALAEGLLQRGHKVTELVIRAPAVRHPNRTSYVVDAPPFDLSQGNDLDAFAHHSLWEDVTGYFEAAKVILASPLASPAFHKLLRHLREDRPHFDVFVQEYVLQEPLLGLNALIGRPPVVTFTAYNMPEDVLDLMGSPFLPSLLPIQGVGVHDCEPMVFRERAYNLLKWIAFKTYYFWEHRPWISQTITETFPEAPPLEDLQRDVAASLVNTNPALHGAIPLVPGIVEVGGVQAKPAKPAEALPADLLAWLDGAAHGFVFVSFGSNVKAENLKKDRVEAMLRAFGRVKQRVLWKYEDKDILARLPPNVRVHKWLPQNDILGKPFQSHFSI